MQPSAPRAVAPPAAHWPSWDGQVSDAGYRGSWAYLDCATALREEQHLFRVGVGVGIGVRASEVRAALSTPWQSSPPYP